MLRFEIGEDLVRAAHSGSGSRSRHRMMTRRKYSGRSVLEQRRVLHGLLHPLIHELGAELPENGNSPVAISKNISPSAYRSLRLSAGLPRICSGETYCGVPSTLLGG